ncbi:MAG: hypothetical protein J5720_07960 [Bacteroidaceae bacterium]|nr:hypothetical protein [Bacteroidaceae bacterium]
MVKVDSCKVHAESLKIAVESHFTGLFTAAELLKSKKYVKINGDFFGSSKNYRNFARCLKIPTRNIAEK